MPGSSFTVLPTVDSTNNYAMALAHDGKAGHGDAFLALEQTAGKGQRGRAWHTGRGQNLAVSVVLQPRPAPALPFYISVCIATAARRLLNRHCPDCTIKWPNDLYYNDRKAGGILIENIFRGQTWLYAIAGLGLNINQTAFDPLLANPVSLRQLTGKTFDIIELGKEFCLLVNGQWRLMTQQSALLMAEYRQHLYKRGQQVKLRRQNRVFSTVVQDVSDDGRLITGEFGETAFQFGEVEWVME